MSRWGDRIRTVRTEKGLTQDQLADLIVEHGGSMDRFRLSNIETGRNENPELATIQSIADALAVDISEFFILPRPEGESGHAIEQQGTGGGARAYDLAIFFQQLRDLVDDETPAPDTLEGDILKAAAALDRALRRLANARAANE